MGTARAEIAVCNIFSPKYKEFGGGGTDCKIGCIQLLYTAKVQEISTSLIWGNRLETAKVGTAVCQNFGETQGIGGLVGGY